MIKSHKVPVAILTALLVSTSTAVFAGNGVSDDGAQAASTPLADRAATLGGQTFKVERTPANYAGVSSQNWVASAEAAKQNPLADRAATLGGKAFTIESADGSNYTAHASDDATADRAFGAPLKDRAETLGGRVFAVERVQSASPQATSFLARFQ